MDVAGLSEDLMVEEKYRPHLRDEELITDDDPSEESLVPFPVNLVRVFTGKELQFGEPTFYDEEEDPLKCDEPEPENNEASDDCEAALESDGATETEKVIIKDEIEITEEETYLSGDGDVTSGNGGESISDERVRFGLLAMKEEVDITEDISSAVFSEGNPSEANSSNEEIHVIHNCCYCSKDFEDKDSFRKHMSVHGLELSKKDDDSLEGSASINQNPDDEGHSCQLCGKVFQGKDKLKTHMNVHSTEISYGCNSYKRFNEKVLSSHLLMHRKENCFRCNVCDKTFNLKQNLAFHLLYHIFDKPMECTVCNKTFRKSYYFKDHMMMHTREKTFSCSDCKMFFYQKTSLRNHVKTHIEKKPHECQFCHEFFSGISNLNEHLLVHTKEKRFVCELCNRSFRQHQNLKAHISAHSREKPYPCSLCNAKFSYETFLKRHVKKHTEDNASSV